ncbi:MAG: hypothetical protein ACE5KM_04095 [Planctomycetaceae bacterium]
MRRGLPGGIVAVVICGCAASESSKTQKTAVYFDRETKAIVVAAVQPTPAVHPRTGRRTLVRALYCAKCRKWKAVPPDAVRNGHPRNHKCPKHGCALTADGPLPEK